MNLHVYILLKSLWKTLSNIIKVLVRLGISLWLGLEYMAETCSIILLDFIHNLARSIRTKTVTCRVPQERRGT